MSVDVCVCVIVQYLPSPYSIFVMNTGARVLRIDSNIEFCGAKRTDDVTCIVISTEYSCSHWCATCSESFYWAPYALMVMRQELVIFSYFNLPDSISIYALIKMIATKTERKKWCGVPVSV